MKLNNQNILIEVDDKTGATSGIYNPSDSFNMNWVIEDSAWGLIDGFTTESVTRHENTITVTTKNHKRSLSLVIKKEITPNGYYETYYLTNEGYADFFLTKDNFGIPFPYSCNYADFAKVLNERCINHVWCGGDSSWLYSVKANGKAPYLVMHTTTGSIDDYSISYDISRTKNGSFYRGVIVLNPREQVILPKETATYCFLYRFSDEKPEFAPLTYDGAIRFTADKYTVLKNEKATLTLEYNGKIDSLSISSEGKDLPFTLTENKAVCHCIFQTLGEKEIFATVNGKKTRLYINVTLPVSQILSKRAKFICEKQQYHHEGSPLDGAYLIYDNENGNLYYENGENDHNACRERIGMGVVVCKALQEEYSDKMMQSLKKHRAFIEREIFDTETGIVCNDIGKSFKWKRIFNFPWLSVYYLEWYNLTGEVTCLKYSAQILLKFFELTNCERSAQCMEIVKISEALKKENLMHLYNELTQQFLRFVDNLEVSQTVDSPESHIIECSWCNEIPSNRLAYHSQAYILTGDEKHLVFMEDAKKTVCAFFANQPDYHLCCIPVRYWDNYWFGKYACYGDIFPHYWSVLIGWALSLYDEAMKGSHNSTVIQNNLSGNLCVFKEDGSAFNNYLYPYKISLYTSNPEYKSNHMKPGIDYGKRYDPWANDQDWAIYYASVLRYKN